MNGWREASTLDPRFFDENHQLNAPGEARLLNILEVNPLNYRTVYIQSSRHPEIDNIRVSNVQQRVMDLTQGEEHVGVELHKGRTYYRPASEVKIINDLYNSSVPTPRLGSSSGGNAPAISTAPTGQ